MFLLASAAPLAALVWFLLQPEDRRKALADKIPEGVGGRAITAAIAFGVLVLLARVALPAFHAASASLQGVLGRIRSARKVFRVLLFPVEGIVWLSWFLLQLLFAVDAFLILVAAVVGLLLAIRIVQPDFLPGVLPDLAR